MSQNLPEGSLWDFLSLRHPNHFLLAGANNRNVIITCRFLAATVQANQDFLNKEINKINNDLQVAHPHSGSSSTWFLVELEFGNVDFWGEGKIGIPGEKPLGGRERINNKLNPHMASTPGFEPGPHRWEASALTTAPPFLLSLAYWPYISNVSTFLLRLLGEILAGAISQYFLHAQIYCLCRTIFIVLRTICALKTFSEIGGLQAYSRGKDSIIFLLLKL